MDVFPEPHFTVESAKGCRVRDTNGKEYLDLSCGIGVTGLGHCHERILAAVAEQSARFSHVSNLFAIDKQKELAEKLCVQTGMQNIMFVNSGTEATETAMKLARKWGQPRGKTGLVGFSGGFHGRSFGAISLTNNPRHRDAFVPLLPDTSTLPYNDVDALDRLDDNTAAVFIEYVQGEGGLSSASYEFNRRLEEKREELNFLIVADEIQSGAGRTGQFLAADHICGDPDVVLMAKAIGGGYPLGATLARGEAARTLTLGDHGSTFGGNPVSCAAGVAYMDVLREEGLVGRAADMGAYLYMELKELQAQYPNLIQEVRGKGLMRGLVLSQPSKPVVDRMLQGGVIANATAGNVIRLLPPFIIKAEEIDEGLEALERALT